MITARWLSDRDSCLVTWSQARECAAEGYTQGGNANEGSDCVYMRVCDGVYRGAIDKIITMADKIRKMAFTILDHTLSRVTTTDHRNARK